MGKNIFLPKMPNEFSLRQHPRRLLARAANEKGPACLSKSIGKDLQRMETSRIDSRHVAHSENYHSAEPIKVFCFFG
jgi:hypothetical protein